MSDESSRKRQYERALRWYPMDWRREHGPALVADLMDQDDARGRQRLAVGDRFSLAIHGLKMWSLQRATLVKTPPAIGGISQDCETAYDAEPEPQCWGAS